MRDELKGNGQDFPGQGSLNPRKVFFFFFFSLFFSFSFSNTDFFFQADFEIVKPISKGAFGRVFLAKKIVTGDVYAIKVPFFFAFFFFSFSFFSFRF